MHEYRISSRLKQKRTLFTGMVQLNLIKANTRLSFCVNFLRKSAGTLSLTVPEICQLVTRQSLAMATWLVNEVSNNNQKENILTNVQRTWVFPINEILIWFYNGHSGNLNLTLYHPTCRVCCTLVRGYLQLGIDFKFLIHSNLFFLPQNFAHRWAIVGQWHECWINYDALSKLTNERWFRINDIRVTMKETGSVLVS